MTFWDATKMVIGPIAVVFGIASTVLVFAANSYIRNIVQEELNTPATALADQHTKLTQHESLLHQHDEEIEDNETTINRQDERFTQFVQEILERL